MLMVSELHNQRRNGLVQAVFFWRTPVSLLPLGAPYHPLLNELAMSKTKGNSKVTLLSSGSAPHVVMNFKADEQLLSLILL